MLNKTSVVVLKDHGKVLLVKDSRARYGFRWTLPGGHVDEKETPYEAAVREATEEVGNAEIDKKEVTVFVHTVPAGEKGRPEHEHECHVFVGRLMGEISLSEEATECGWFTIDQAKKMDLTDFARKAIDFLSITGK